MRAAKLAMARKMLKEHQEKKQVTDDKSDNSSPKTVNSLNGLNESDYVILPDNESEKSDIELAPSQPEIDVIEPDNDTTTIDYKIKYEEQLKAVEFLTASNRHLEMRVLDLQYTINQIESNNSDSMSNHNAHRHEINALQAELNNVKEDHIGLRRELDNKNKHLEDRFKTIQTLNDQISNLLEELDISKTALVARENECSSLQSYISNLQRELESTQLCMQQLTHGHTNRAELNSGNIEDIDVLLQKLDTLERQLKNMMAEKEQTRMQFETYVQQLTDNLNHVAKQNGDLKRKNDALSDREIELVGQISGIELRMQKLMRENKQCQKDGPLKVAEAKEIAELQKHKCELLEESLKELKQNYKEVVEELETLKKIQDEKVPTEAQVECTHEAQNINLTKLQADIASDKIAAQMATTQNVQLKDEIQHLKKVFDKMSQDKLELTEKLDAEKFLNRQLTLKLSEIDEKAKETHTKLMAKDKEMIRLISSYNEIEQKMKEQASKINAIQTEESMIEHNVNCVSKHLGEDGSNGHGEEMPLINTHEAFNATEEHTNALNISIKDGMFRLQDSFLKKMNELAELSDEKQRLEHIILQLQSETDTICEYVALYQQQRGILKERERERKMQLKFLETERKRMKSQLDILRDIILKFSTDETLKEYFKKDQRQRDVSEIMNLLSSLNKSYLIDETKQLSEIHLYHCSWCSGKVIDV